jgi:uncharacterized membrane protein
MDKIKLINWKLIIYWFLVMSVVNVYLIPKFVIHEPITNKRIIIGVIVSLIVSFLMGLFSVPKPNDKQQ